MPFRFELKQDEVTLSARRELLDSTVKPRLQRSAFWLLARERILLLSQKPTVFLSEIMIREHCTLDTSFMLFAYVA